jgi:hypothetical protein
MIKNELTAAAFGEGWIDRSTAFSRTEQAQLLLKAADRLAHGAGESDT